MRLLGSFKEGGAVMNDRLTAERRRMGIAGLSTYSNTSFYYAATSKNKNGSMKNDIDGFITSYVTQYLEENANLEDYPEIAGKMSEELSSEKISEEVQPEEIVTPLGFGFANGGMMGYGMSAALVEKPGSNDIIIQVKLATGSGDEVLDVNHSEFAPSNATAVEMFAYCQYKDAIGEGVNSKWGSWNVALAKSRTSLADPKTVKAILSVSDLIELLEESNKLTAQELKEDKDWRALSDDEWDKMLESVDAYLDVCRERLKQMKEKQEEAARKAALEADADMRTTAAASAALSVAANGVDDPSEGTMDADTEEDTPTKDGVKHEKNWTKNLDTDDQTVLRTAKRAQEMEQMAMSKFQEVQLTDNTTTGISQVGNVTECDSVEDDENNVLEAMLFWN